MKAPSFASPIQPTPNQKQVSTRCNFADSHKTLRNSHRNHQNTCSTRRHPALPRISLGIYIWLSMCMDDLSVCMSCYVSLLVIGHHLKRKIVACGYQCLHLATAFNERIKWIEGTSFWPVVCVDVHWHCISTDQKPNAAFKHLNSSQWKLVKQVDPVNKKESKS